MTPQEVADCLVQELWQTLRASLEAQVRVAFSTRRNSPRLARHLDTEGVTCPYRYP